MREIEPVLPLGDVPEAMAMSPEVPVDAAAAVIRLMPPESALEAPVERKVYPPI